MSPFMTVSANNGTWVSTKSSFTFTMPDWVVSLFAESETNPYTIKFHGNGNTNETTMPDLPMHYDVSENLTTNTFEKIGYTFQGWSENSWATVQTWTDWQSVKNLTEVESWVVDLYAIWKANTYQVRFDLNQEWDSDNLNIATGTMANLDLAYDTTGTLTSNAFVRTWYDFAGWALSSNWDVVYSNGWKVFNLTTTSWAVVPLYAKWTAKSGIDYTVNHYLYDLNDANPVLTGTDNLKAVTYTEVTPPTHHYTGFIAPATQTVYVKWNGSTVINYYYTRNSYTLSFNTTGSAVASKTYKYEEPFGELSGSLQSWYDFNGWLSGTTLVNENSTMPASNLELSASWTARTDTKYHVYHYLKDIGTDTYTFSWVLTQELSWETASTLVLSGHKKTLEGFTYLTWATTSWSTLPENPVATTTIAKDWSTNIYLYYTRNIHTVTMNTSIGIDSVATETQNVEYGDTVTLWATVNNCYTWSKWTGESEETNKNYSFTMPDHNVTYTANATINSWDLTVTNDKWANVSETEVRKYNCWEIVNLRASVLSGYTWKQWSISGLEGISTSWDIITSFTMPNNAVSAKAEVTKNTDTVYKVRHEMETLNHTYDTGTQETNVNTIIEVFTWETDSSITPALKNLTWFTAPATQTTTIEGDGSTVVTYKYTRNSYPLTLHTSKGVKSVHWSWSYLYQQEVNVSAILFSGYENLAWIWDKTGASFTMPSTGVDMTATATAHVYTISYNVGSGTISWETTSYTVEDDDITLVKPTRTGYTFEWWTGTDVDTATETVVITGGSLGDRSYTANWIANDVKITVKHYKMLVNWTYASEPDDVVDTQKWKSDTTITADLKDYGPGFKQPQAKTVYVKPDGSAEVEYQYERNQFNVTLTALTWVKDLQWAGSYYYDASVTLSWALKDGYKNLTWTGDYQTSIFNMPSGHVAVSAYATPITYTITFDSKSGTAIADKTYNVETPDFILDEPTRVGYTFQGWTGMDLTVPTKNLKITQGSIGNRYYEAVWSADKVKVTIIHKRMNLNGTYDESWELVETIENTTDYSADQENAIIYALTKYGDWFEVPENVNKDKIAADGTTTVTIYYPRKHFNANFNALTWVKDLVGSGSYFYWTRVSLTGSLVDWYTGFTYSGYTTESGFTMPAENVLVEAYATPITYTITYDSQGGTEIADTTYNVETPDFTLAKPSKTWYDFAGWTGSNGTVAQENVVIAKWTIGDKHYVANWSPRNDTNYVIHHYVKEVGKATYAEQTGVIDELTGTTDATLVFNNLKKTLPCATYSSGSLSGTTSWPGVIATETTIKPDGSTHIYLYYTRNTHNVNLDKDANIVSVTWSGNYECGAKVTVSATPNNWYHFKQWLNRSGAGKTIVEE